VSEKEALQYLKARELSDDQASKIYQLVGGRMVHLEMAADKIIQNRHLPGMLGAFCRKQC
jgi:hypothetical protein